MLEKLPPLDSAYRPISIYSQCIALTWFTGKPPITGKPLKQIFGHISTVNFPNELRFWGNIIHVSFAQAKYVSTLFQVHIPCTSFASITVCSDQSMNYIQWVLCPVIWLQLSKNQTNKCKKCRAVSTWWAASAWHTLRILLNFWSVGTWLSAGGWHMLSGGWVCN